MSRLHSAWSQGRAQLLKILGVVLTRQWFQPIVVEKETYVAGPPMKTEAYEQLMATAMQRELTPAEHQVLSQLFHEEPGLEEQWSLDLHLSRAMRNLPIPTVSSNFTSLVLQAVQREQNQRQASSPGILLRLQRIGRAWQVGFASAVVLGCFLVQWQYGVRTTKEMAQNLASLPTEVWSNASLWKDFESIRTLELANSLSREGSQTYSDRDLFKALQ